MPVIKRNVNSLSKSGSAKLKGDVTLTGGTNVTLTQSGNDISIAASGGGSVTVTDSAEIDFTLTGQDITASLVAGSIDETKLDLSVNASLDLADTAVQNLADLGITSTATELNYTDGVTSAIQTQLDAKATSSDLTTHMSDTTTHGTTGDVVGTSDTQTLTNKTISGSSNTISNIGTSSVSDDAITAAKLLYGNVRSRQGGSSTIWTTSGTTTYDVSATDVFVQCGSKANNASPTSYTFPTAFTYAPVVIVQVITASGANCYAVVSSVTATGFNCQVVTDAGAANTGQTVSWVAIGQ